MKIKRPSTKVLALGLLALSLVMAIFFVVQRAGPLAPVRVTVVQAVKGTLSPALFGIGTVEARRSYLIGPTSAGRVLRVLVDAGDVVKAGQLLAEMDPVDQDSRLTALDASLARARSTIGASEAQLADAVARDNLAKITAQRYVALGQQNFMSAGAVEAKLQEQASAEANVRSSQANLAAVRQELLRLKAERAALLQQRQTLRLLASHDSTVMSRDAEPGSTVVAGQAVLKLVDTRSLWVKARFDQGRSAGLTAGLAANIVLRSNAGQTLAGQLARVELQGDSVTEERIAQINFMTFPAGLVLGELAEVTLQLAHTASSLIVPNAVIKRQGEQTGVWILVENTPKFVVLRLGQSSLDGRVQVLAGLSINDRIVAYSEKEINAKSRIEAVSSLVELKP
jgi:HlyD family secretion protein